jgi:hypothetical protein
MNLYHPNTGRRLKTHGIDWRHVRRRIHAVAGYVFPVLVVVVPAILDHKSELPRWLDGVLTVLAIGQTAVHYYRDAAPAQKPGGRREPGT